MTNYILQYWAIPVLTIALVLVTGYYAWQTRKTVEETKKLADETKRMAEATGRLADISHKAYLVSLAPEIECMRGPQTKTVGKTGFEYQIRNLGRYPITWHKIWVHYTQGANQHEKNERLVDQQILPKNVKEAGIEWPSNTIVDDIVVEMLDPAGGMHEISLKNIHADRWS